MDEFKIWPHILRDFEKRRSVLQPGIELAAEARKVKKLARAVIELWLRDVVRAVASNGNAPWKKEEIRELLSWLRTEEAEFWFEVLGAEPAVGMRMLAAHLKRKNKWEQFLKMFDPGSTSTTLKLKKRSSMIQVRSNSAHP